MLWQIEGADKTTGKDATILVTADTEADARTSPEALAIYISACAPAEFDEENKESRKPGAVATDSGYEELKGVADLTDGFGVFAMIIGVLGIVVGIGFFIAASAGDSTYTTDIDTLAERARFHTTMIGSGIELTRDGGATFVFGLLLRVVGNIGLAVRDIARNSFRKPSP